MVISRKAEVKRANTCQTGTSFTVNPSELIPPDSFTPLPTQRNRAGDNKTKTTLPCRASCHPWWLILIGLLCCPQIPEFLFPLQNSSSSFRKHLERGVTSGIPCPLGRNLALQTSSYSKVSTPVCFESSFHALQSSAPRFLPNLTNICSTMEQTILQKGKHSVAGTLGSSSFQAGCSWMGVQVPTSTTSDSCVVSAAVSRKHNYPGIRH